MLEPLTPTEVAAIKRRVADVEAMGYVARYDMVPPHMLSSEYENRRRQQCVDDVSRLLATVEQLQAENEELRANLQQETNHLARLSQAYVERGDQLEALAAALREFRTSFASTGQRLCFCERECQCGKSTCRFCAHKWTHHPWCLQAREALGEVE